MKKRPYVEMTKEDVQEIYDAKLSINLWAGDAYYAVRNKDTKLAALCRKKANKLAKEILTKYDIILG